MNIIFHEKDNCLHCVTKDVNKWSILASISRYKYFYKKVICFVDTKKCLMVLV